MKTDHNINMLRKGLKEILLVSLGMVAAILGSIVLYDRYETVGKELEGKQVPNFEFEYSTGKKSSLHKEAGKVILVNFWATWCGPCMQEMPSMKMLELHLRPKGLLLLAFNVGETESEARRRLGGTEYPEHLIFGFSKASLDLFRVGAIPITLLVDSKGIVRRVYSGPQNWLDPEVLRELELHLKLVSLGL